MNNLYVSYTILWAGDKNSNKKRPPSHKSLQSRDTNQWVAEYNVVHLAFLVGRNQDCLSTQKSVKYNKGYKAKPGRKIHCMKGDKTEIYMFS